MRHRLEQPEFDGFLVNALLSYTELYARLAAVRLYRRAEETKLAEKYLRSGVHQETLGQDEI